MAANAKNTSTNGAQAAPPQAENDVFRQMSSSLIDVLRDGTRDLDWIASAKNRLDETEATTRANQQGLTGVQGAVTNLQTLLEEIKRSVAAEYEKIRTETKQALETIIKGEIEKAKTPIGGVVAFAADHDRIPVEFLECNGAELDASEYPELFKVIGYKYGGSNGKFRTPNYQGCFLRALDPTGNIDRDNQSRLSSLDSSGQQIGARVGSFQRSANKRIRLNHDAEVTLPQNIFTEIGDNVHWQRSEGPKAVRWRTSAVPNVRINIQPHDTGNTEDSRDHESRPVNVAVLYIIRAK